MTQIAYDLEQIKYDHVTAPKAAEMIGVHHNTVLFWERRGTIKSVRIPGDKRDGLYFHIDEVKEFAERRKWPTFSEVCNWTGLSHKALGILVDAGYVVGVPVDSMNKLRWRVEVSSLKSALEKVASNLAEILLDRDSEPLRNWRMGRWLEKNLPKRRVGEVAERRAMRG